ncbi:MAG: SPOR domain-containing protein [Emergencia sp.]
MKKRRIRRYRSQKRNSGVKFAGILGIMILAVFCGYMTARFIIAPLLGYDAEVLKLDFPSKMTSFFEGKADEETGGEGETDDDGQSSGSGESTDAAEEKGYALQFGLFTTRERAEQLAEELKTEGINAVIRETGDGYKVTGPVLSTREKAVEKLKETESDRVKDVFITVIP